MITSNNLQKLLRDCNTRGYADAAMASETAKYVDNGKGGLVLHATIGSYTYEDEFYGGQPYSGNETIWEDGKALFRCVYWGQFFNEPYESFLREALAAGPNGACVHRGPEHYQKGNLEYTNGCVGTIESFRQTERILKNGKEMYIAYFIGGRVCVA